MKRILSSPLSLILIAFLLASTLLACPNVSTSTTGTDDGGTSTEDPGDTGDTGDSAEPSEGLAFIQSSVVGWEGSASATVTATSVDGFPAWSVINNTWNASPVFSIALGASHLGDYAGISCKVRIDSDHLEWRNLSVEADGGSGLDAIQAISPKNILIAAYSLGSTASNGVILELSIPFLGLDDAVSSLTDTIQLAIGISGDTSTVYTIYDLVLVERPAGAVFWVDAPSLKLAAVEEFDYFGIAVNANDLADPAIMDGLVVHADSVTIGNEFKPDYILGKEPASTTTFIALDGNEYDVPASLNFTTVDASLELCRVNGLEMRGHVLVWHSQSPDWFFREGFSGSAALVSSTVMNARLEWYIKSVLEHITEWENTNNAGERIITTWDVVNEAVSDNPDSAVWLRGSDGSTDTDWFAIYGDEEFIVNAFVYANRYAPAEVLLAYNDYNAERDYKTTGIVRVIESIQNNPDARIDVLGMQSHHSMDWPGVDRHRTAIDAILAALQ